jgi:hypothetical protein
MKLITEIRNRRIELAGSILYSIPTGGDHPPRKYVIVSPSSTIFIKKSEIIRHKKVLKKLNHHDNDFLFKTIITGAINIGTITCKIGR